MSNPTEQEINANGCRQDMSHVMEYDISIPTHAPDIKSLLIYMTISWGVVILGMLALATVESQGGYDKNSLKELEWHKHTQRNMNRPMDKKINL
jgi:hypothetical protein